MRALLVLAGSGVLLAGCGGGVGLGGGGSNTVHVSPNASSQAVTNAIGRVINDHFNDPTATAHCRVGPTRATCATGTKTGSNTVFDASIRPDGTIVVHRLGKVP